MAQNDEISYTFNTFIYYNFFFLSNSQNNTSIWKFRDFIFNGCIKLRFAEWHYELQTADSNMYHGFGALLSILFYLFGN